MFSETKCQFKVTLKIFHSFVVVASLNGFDKMSGGSGLAKFVMDSY